MCCGLAVSPGKPRVPYCEERPGAAHSRRDQKGPKCNRAPQAPLKRQVGSVRGVCRCCSFTRATMYGELPAPVAVAHKCHSSNIVDVLNLFR